MHFPSKKEEYLSWTLIYKLIGKEMGMENGNIYKLPLGFFVFHRLYHEDLTLIIANEIQRWSFLVFLDKQSKKMNQKNQEAFH